MKHIINSKQFWCLVSKHTIIRAFSFNYLFTSSKMISKYIFPFRDQHILRNDNKYKRMREGEREKLRKFVSYQASCYDEIVINSIYLWRCFAVIPFVVFCVNIRIICLSLMKVFKKFIIIGVAYVIIAKKTIKIMTIRKKNKLWEPGRCISWDSGKYLKVMFLISLYTLLALKI